MYIGGLQLSGPFTYRTALDSLLDYGDGAGIYIIENADGSYKYIGSSGKLTQRFREHFSELNRGIHNKSELQRDYDEEERILIYFKLCLDRDQAFSEEQLLLDHFSNSNLLNVAIDATKPWVRGSGYVNHFAGKKHSEETKQQLSAIRKAYFDDGNKHPMLGKEHSEETKKKLSESRKSREWSEAERNARSGHHSGKQVVIDGVEYATMQIASAALGIKYGTLYWRVMTDAPAYSNYQLK